MSAPLVVGAVCARPECGHGEDLHDGICFGTACECVRFVESAGALPMPAGPARSELGQVADEIARFGIFGAAVPATKALVKRADELVTENGTLRARVAGLEAERHSTNEALDDAVQALRERQAEREALVERMRAGQRWQRGRSPELVSENLVSQSELRSIFGIPLITPWDEAAEAFVPQTERSRWVAIADALNAAHAAGMPVGIDMDGTLTDHNAWSVVWDRAADRWAVAGYEDGFPALDASSKGTFAERAAAETDPARRAAWRMLADPEPEFDAYLRHPYRTGHDLPETGGDGRG